MKKEIIMTLNIIILYISITIISAIVKGELIFSFFDTNTMTITRVSFYLSTVISALFSFIIMNIIFIAIWFFLVVINSTISVINYSSSIKWVATMLIYNELIKLILALVILYDEINEFDVSISIIDNIEKTFWFKACTISDIIFLVLGVSALFIVLRLSNETKKHEPYIAAILVCILLIAINSNIMSLVFG